MYIQLSQGELKSFITWVLLDNNIILPTLYHHMKITDIVQQISRLLSCPKPKQSKTFAITFLFWFLNMHSNPIPLHFSIFNCIIHFIKPANLTITISLDINYRIHFMQPYTHWFYYAVVIVHILKIQKTFIILLAKNSYSSSYYICKNIFITYNIIMILYIIYVLY